MRFALSEQAMRRAEERVVAERGEPLRALMERAGTAVAEEVGRRFPDGLVLVAAGGGNNGGDGWVAARLMRERGREVRVLAVADPGQLRGVAAAAFADARAAGVPFDFPPPLGIDAAPQLARAGVIVDALFGIGFRGDVREPYASFIREMLDADAPVVAVDVPSGVEADTGIVRQPYISAALTVTFSALKPGALLQPGRTAFGEIVVADVGVPEDLLAAEADVEVLDANDVSLLMPLPRPDDNKGSRGRVLLVAGSARYTGAAVLAATGALRMGAGYVTVASTQAVVDVVHAALPSAIALPLASAEDGSLDASAAEEVCRLAASADALVIGPGLTPTPAIAASVRALLATGLPAVVDADALNVLADDVSALSRRAPTLVTPHPGELARLLGRSGAEVLGDRLCYAREMASRGMTCMLKAAGSVVCDGDRAAIVPAGNAGLAKAGSGDVLSGMLGTLLAQGLSPYEAAVLGGWLHGRAADLAAEELTEVSLLPTDLPAFLPAAVAELL